MKGAGIGRQPQAVLLRRRDRVWLRCCGGVDSFPRKPRAMLKQAENESKELQGGGKVQRWRRQMMFSNEGYHAGLCGDVHVSSVSTFPIADLTVGRPFPEFPKMAPTHIHTRTQARTWHSANTVLYTVL